MPSFVNLPANSCRRFPFTGYGNPRRVPTGITQYLDTTVTATSPNRFSPVFFCYGTDCEGAYAATCLPSLVNLLANFCRGFPFTGFGNPQRVPTNVPLYSDVTQRLIYKKFLAYLHIISSRFAHTDTCIFYEFLLF